MKTFKDLNITSTNNYLTGEKIEIYNVLNREIKVKNYKIEPSKYADKGNGKRLNLQFDLDGKEHILFTGSGVLMDLISKTNTDDFPFTTTIVKDNKCYKFT